jgi:hypothetical protein
MIPSLNYTKFRKNMPELTWPKGGRMAETKTVRAVERAEAPEQKERPKRKPKVHINRDFKFYPFADALRHLVIKENK